MSFLGLVQKLPNSNEQIAKKCREPTFWAFWAKQARDAGSLDLSCLTLNVWFFKGLKGIRGD